MNDTQHAYCVAIANDDDSIRITRRIIVASSSREVIASYLYNHNATEDDVRRITFDATRDVARYDDKCGLRIKCARHVASHRFTTGPK